MTGTPAAPTLHDHEAPDNPLALFDQWLEQANASGMFVPNACAVATVTPDGTPAVRMVLLKGHDAESFVFYTNYDSDKAAQLDASGKASLLFWWREVQRQIRITGTVSRTDTATNAAYFATRPRGSQLGAWASRQSAPIESRDALDARFKAVDARFEGDDEVPCPEFWGGYRVVAETIEFWQGRDDRMHDRIRYVRGDAGGWTRGRLMP